MTTPHKQAQPEKIVFKFADYANIATPNFYKPFSLVEREIRAKEWDKMKSWFTLTNNS